MRPLLHRRARHCDRRSRWDCCAGQHRGGRSRSVGPRRKASPQSHSLLFWIALAFSAPFLGGFENIMGIIIIGDQGVPKPGVIAPRRRDHRPVSGSFPRPRRLVTEPVSDSGGVSAGVCPSLAGTLCRVPGAPPPGPRGHAAPARRGGRSSGRHGRRDRRAERRGAEPSSSCLPTTQAEPADRRQAGGPRPRSRSANPTLPPVRSQAPGGRASWRRSTSPACAVEVFFGVC